MAIYSPTQIENMTVNGEKKSKLSEPVGVRGEGTLVYKNQGSGTEVYYRYRRNGKDQTIFIGRCSPNARSRMSITEVRDKAREYAKIKREIAPADLKEYLEIENTERQRQQAIKKREQEIESSLGTLKDLCESYVASLERRNAVSARDVKSNLKFDLLKAWPKLCERRANSITPEDILPVFQRILERGVTTKYNRFRSSLLAAFNLGIKSDYDPRFHLQNGKQFKLQHNPVSVIPVYSEFERARKRTLSDDELYSFWHNMSMNNETLSPLYGLIIRLCLACFGNRPQQLARITWDDIDFEQRTLTYIDSKGKGAIPKQRIIPLTERALDTLRKARLMTYDFDGPFRITGKSPIDVKNLGTYVSNYNDWVQNEAIAKGKKPPERFVMRDLRRTATRLFTDCRVLKEHRYLLQSRGDGSVESKHYDHDDRLPEKWDIARIYDQYLGQIVEKDSNSASGNVIDFQSRKRHRA